MSGVHFANERRKDKGKTEGRQGKDGRRTGERRRKDRGDAAGRAAKAGQTDINILFNALLGGLFFQVPYITSNC